MKQFLKSIFCIGLLLTSSAITLTSSSCVNNCSSNDSCKKSSNCSSNDNCKSSDSCRSSNDNCKSSDSCRSSNDSCKSSDSCRSSNDSCKSSDSCNESSSCNNKCSNNCSNDCSISCSQDSCRSNDCACCTSAPVRTYLQVRSQGANTARELVGWQWDLNLPWMCCNYGAAYLAYEYQRTFDSRHIANSYFGGKTLKFQGSLVPNRSDKALLADNFGLSRTFDGILHVNPSIQNHIIDLGYYLGLDSWLQGSYVRLHFPIVYSFWDLNACEKVITPGDTTVSACYYGSDEVETSPIPVPYSTIPTTTVTNSLKHALSGTYLFGDMQTPWCAGRFNFCGKGIWALADIDVILGYNFIITDCYHFGAYLQMVLNTPPKPKDFHVFSPVIGNGSHFELGAGISAHWSLWSNEEQNFAVFLEGNITHLFNNEQCRLFDFCDNGPFSRYMLLKEYDTNGLTYTYNGSLISATCFANQKVSVKIDIKGDLSVKLAYRVCNWGIDIGYNIYGNTHETVQTKCYEENCAPTRILSPKGTSSVCCPNYPIVCVLENCTYVPNIFPAVGAVIPADAVACDLSTGTCPVDDETTTPFRLPYTVYATPNNGSQPLATAYSGYPVTLPIESAALGVPTNCSVALSLDNTKNIPAGGQPFTHLSELVKDGYVLCDVAPLSVPLTKKDLNRVSAESVSQMTNKIFGFFSYTYYDSCGWNPQVGVGAEVEWEHRINPEVCKPTDVCQWGVWFKGSMAY